MTDDWKEEYLRLSRTDEKRIEPKTPSEADGAFEEISDTETEESDSDGEDDFNHPPISYSGVGRTIVDTAA